MYITSATASSRNEYSNRFPMFCQEVYANFVGDMLFEKGNLTLDNLIDNLDAKSKPRFIQALLDIIDWLKQKLKGNKEITLELVRLETKYLRALNAAQKAWEQKQQTAEQQKTSTESGGEYSVSDGKFTDYDKPITLDDIKTLRDIGRKSINEFSTEEVEIAQKWAHKFYQQLGIKSPFFRRWFGDWRAYDKNTLNLKSNIKRLLIQTPDQAVEYFKNGLKNRTLFRGDVKNNDTKFVINVGAQIYNDTLTYSNRNFSRRNDVDEYQIRLSILNNIKDIVSSSVLLDTEIANTEKKTPNMYQSFFHKFYTLAEIDGKQYLVKLTVDELNSDDTVRRAYNVNDIKISPVAVSQVYKPAGTTDNIGDLLSTISISDLFNLVKQYDSEFKPKPVNEALINKADGTPKVFYHGTNAEFTEFDKRKSKPGFYGRGFYFTTEKSQANVYGNEMEVYLNIKQPLMPNGAKITETQIIKFLEAVAENEDYSIENYGTYDVRQIVNNITSRDAFDVIQDINATAIGDFGEALQLFNEVNSTEFDGIITPTETIVYNANQIKSAKYGGNIGTFSEAENDIRYSLPDGENTDFTAEMDALDEQYQNGEIDRADYLEQMNDLYRKAGETYGTIKQGETVTGNENFDNPVPQSVDGNKQTWVLLRRFIGISVFEVALFGEVGIRHDLMLGQGTGHGGYFVHKIFRNPLALLVDRCGVVKGYRFADEHLFKPWGNIQRHKLQILAALFIIKLGNVDKAVLKIVNDIVAGRVMLGEDDDPCTVIQKLDRCFKGRNNA